MDVTAMGHYFNDDECMATVAGDCVEKTLEVISSRYLKLNPRGTVTFRAYSHSGILRGEDYRYHADFAAMFPEARDEQCVFA